MRAKRLVFILLLLYPACQASTASAENVRETPVVKTVRECAPMVVNISTQQLVLLQQNPFWGGQFGNQADAFYDPFFNLHRPVTFGTLQVQSLGSGILVSPDGLIATNAHVIAMASKVFVTTMNGEPVEARLIGTDNANDIALLKVEAPGPLPYVRFAKDVFLGETAVSIGNPLGLQNSISVGVVSGTGRQLNTQPQIEAFKDLIQTDASINQGSSGGALINLEGKLIGMNLAFIQEANGVGFAIPATKIQRMLQEYEKVRKEEKKAA